MHYQITLSGDLGTIIPLFTSFSTQTILYLTLDCVPFTDPDTKHLQGSHSVGASQHGAQRPQFICRQKAEKTKLCWRGKYIYYISFMLG